jgi:hypothetical protein
MTVWVARRSFSLDPLMAEAKRRAQQRRMLIVLAILLAGLAVGLTFAFGSPGGRSPNGGGLTSGNYSNSQNGGSGPLAVTTGMTAKAVLATAGRPSRVLRSNPRNPDCWAYPLGDINGKRDWWSTYGEVVAVCLKHGRVDYVGP